MFFQISMPFHLLFLGEFLFKLQNPGQMLLLQKGVSLQTTQSISKQNKLLFPASKAAAYLYIYKTLAMMYCDNLSSSQPPTVNL